jgi:hypothetical protein
MRRTIIALGALITAASLQMATPARAEIDYPFCRSAGGDVGYGNMRCDYSTFEQCQATSSGLGGSCLQNPFYHANANANASMSHRGRRAH